MRLKNPHPLDAFTFALVWLLLFVAGQSKLFRDPGTFAHTAFGNYILDRDHLIHQDSFSFTRFGEPWVAQQWLGECIMAAIHRLAGFDGLLIVTVSLIALLYSGLCARVERSGMNMALGSFVLALSLAASSHHFHVRPHIVTVFFMAVIFARLCDVEAGRKNLTALFWLIPVFVVWANIHGGVLGGLFTLLLVASGWTLIDLLGSISPAQNKRDMAILWTVVFLGLVAPLANPYGLKLPATWIDIMGSDAVAQLMQEHASAVSLFYREEATSYITVFFLLCLGLFYIALLAGTDLKDQKVTWYIPLVWFFLSLSRIRHAPLFAVIAVVAIAEMFPCCHWVQRLGNKGVVSFRLREVSDEMGGKYPKHYLIAAAVAAIALVAFQGSAQMPATEQKWVKLDRAHWPVDLLPELQSIEKSRPPGTSIFNDMLFGGFLIYHTPSFRVFIDDRCELYGDELLMKYAAADRSDFEAWEKTYRFDLALLLPNSNYRKYFETNPDWRTAKQCAAGVLYERSGAPSGLHP